MTIKQLAEFTGKTERTIQRWVVKANDKMSAVGDKMSAVGHGVCVDYTIDEIQLILEAGTMSKDAVSILMANARNSSQQNVVVDYEIIGKMIGMAITTALMPIVEKLDKVTEQKKAQLQLEAPKMDSRAIITKSVNEYARNAEVSHRDAYVYLYREYGYRTHCNPSVSAKNRGMKIIDYIDSEGQIDLLAAIAQDIIKEL